VHYLQAADAALHDNRSVDAKASHSCHVLLLFQRRGRRRRHIARDDSNLQGQRDTRDKPLYSELHSRCGRSRDDALAQLQRLVYDTRVVDFDDDIAWEQLAASFRGS
jgi:hypothetical protein